MIKITHRRLLTGMILVIPPMIAAAAPRRAPSDGDPIGQISPTGMVLGVEALLLSGMGFARSQRVRFEAEYAARSARPAAAIPDAPILSTSVFFGSRRECRVPHAALPASVPPPCHHPWVA